MCWNLNDNLVIYDLMKTFSYLSIFPLTFKQPALKFMENKVSLFTCNNKSLRCVEMTYQSGNV